MGHRVFHWLAVIKMIRQSSIVLSFLATKGKVSSKTFLNVMWNSPLDEYCLLVTWGLSRVFIFYNFAITFVLHIFAHSFFRDLPLAKPKNSFIPTWKKFVLSPRDWHFRFFSIVLYIGFWSYEETFLFPINL